MSFYIVKKLIHTDLSRQGKHRLDVSMRWETGVIWSMPAEAERFFSFQMSSGLVEFVPFQYVQQLIKTEIGHEMFILNYLKQVAFWHGILYLEMQQMFLLFLSTYCIYGSDLLLYSSKQTLVTSCDW